MLVSQLARGQAMLLSAACPRRFAPRLETSVATLLSRLVLDLPLADHCRFLADLLRPAVRALFLCTLQTQAFRLSLEASRFRPVPRPEETQVRLHCRRGRRNSQALVRSRSLPGQELFLWAEMSPSAQVPLPSLMLAVPWRWLVAVAMKAVQRRLLVAASLSQAVRAWILTVAWSLLIPAVLQLRVPATSR
jgi:hypothetical protein